MEHLVQSGDYYRLVNPFENNNHVLWQFVSKDKKETVVCGVRLHSEANPYIYLSILRDWMQICITKTLQPEKYTQAQH